MNRPDKITIRGESYDVKWGDCHCWLPGAMFADHVYPISGPMKLYRESADGVNIDHLLEKAARLHVIRDDSPHILR